MEKLDKKTYRGIVKFTLESMLNLSKTDKNYNLAADTIYYYENTIVPEGQITQRNFSAKFKSELVIELLKGEKDLNTIATENNIQPNLLRNWKKEFLDKASVVFDDTREDNLKEKLALERKEKAENAKKVGQLLGE